MKNATIPRIAHFVVGLQPQVEPFHLVHCLAIASCLGHVQPEEVHVHYHYLPHGPYWDLVRSRVVLHRVELVPEVTAFTYTDRLVARYAYAHHADFVRLDVLARWGGLYADTDTLFVSPLPEGCWDAPATIGREAEVPDPATGSPRPSLSNALLMSRPGGAFVEAWRERMATALDGTWSAHSCLLAQDVAAEMPDSVHVEPRRTFHAFEPTRAGLRRLLVDPPVGLDGVASLHLMAHLWWEEARRDFLDLHSGTIDERWVREVDTTYGVAARTFLPEHETARPRRRTPDGAAFRYIVQSGATGYAAAGTRLVSAVRASGVPVELAAWFDSGGEGAGRPVRHPTEDPADAAVAPPGAPTVAHLVPEHLPDVQTSSDGPVVVHTTWETDRPPGHWPALLNRSDGVIVPTAWNREQFLAAGVQLPIDVVPHVLCEPTMGDAGAGLRLPDDVVVFYTISRWDERKVPALVVRAFLEAFTVDDQVALVVKTGRFSEAPPPDDWGRGSPMSWTPSWQVARLLRDHPRPPPILLAVEEWDQSRIAGLHTRGDCYVTLSHGVGWGLGSFDACAYGNPVVATGWGGHLAYVDGCRSLVDFDLVRVVHKDPASYAPEQRWAEPRLQHAVELLRSIAADLDAARRHAAPMRQRVLRDFAGPVVAARFLAAMSRFGEHASQGSVVSGR